MQQDPRLGLVLTKITLLVLTAVCTHVSLSPPQPPVPSKQYVTRRTFFERCVRWMTFASKSMVWLGSVSDSIATWLAYRSLQTSSPELFAFPDACPSSPISPSYPVNSSLINQTIYFDPPHTPYSRSLFAPSFLSVIGFLSVLLAALLRTWCFKTLGTFFTFEITIRPEHKLITTGPYAWVRHPSYIGIFLTLVGSTLVMFAPGSWLWERWLTSNQVGKTCTSSFSFPTALGFLPLPLSECLVSNVAQVLVYSSIAFWFVKTWYALRGTLKRMAIEDAELRKFFGETWEEYARNVAWKMLPGLY